MLPPGFRKAFGPGLMWAAAAIGVSHLVQSTRAGALLGFGFAGVILLALIFKYPFFEFGPRYAAATGTSLIEGYKRIGNWALWTYFLLMLITAVIHQLAIILFMAFLVQYGFGTAAAPWIIGAFLYAGCATLLILGRFRALDVTIKVILAVLAISTFIAAAIAAPRADLATLGLVPRIGVAGVSLGFILALVGFMPSPVEVAAMNSLWTVAKDRASGVRSSVAAATLDFKIGYWGTGILAFGFLLLGTAVMYGSGESFSPAGAVFATQLVDLYTATLGEWTRPIVLVAVMMTIFSTTLIVIDGFPRVIDRCVQNIGAGTEVLDGMTPPGRTYWIALAAFGLLNVLGLRLFVSNLTPMIDFATIFTFITSPLLGYLNLRAVTSDDVPPEHRPGRGMLWVSYIGLGLLVVTTLAYVASRLI